MGQNTPNAYPGWIRRGLAFAIDYTLFKLMWDLVNNAISAPVAEVFMSLLAVAFFCLYFGVSEGIGKTRGSLGKRLLSLRLVSRDGSLPKSTSVVARAAILTAILLPPWDSILAALPFGQDMPTLASVLAAIPMTLILYNVWLAFRRPDGLMLQDALTRTRVLPSAIFREEPTVRAPIFAGHLPTVWPRRDVCLLALLIGIVSGCYFRNYFQSASDLDTAMEATIAREVGVRSSVSVATEWSVGSDKSGRTLEVSIWLPAIVWNDKTIKKSMDAALSELNVEPGFYSSGEIRVWCDPFLEIDERYPLELPKPPPRGAIP